jgi:hypothetical protein
MQLILLCVGVSTVRCNACGWGGRCLPDLEFFGEGGDGDFGAAEEEAPGAAESAVEDWVHGGEGELYLGGENVERKGDEAVGVGLHLAREGRVLGVCESTGAVVIAAEGLSAFGDAAAAAAVGIAVCAFVDHVASGGVVGCWFFVVGCHCERGSSGNKKAQPTGSARG